MPQQSPIQQKGAPADTTTDTPDEMKDQVNKQMQLEDTEGAEGVALAAVDELAEVSGSVEGLQKQVKGLQEQVLRRAAEFQNYRRRTDSQLGNAARRGREEVVLSLLDVFDDLRRSIGAADQAGEAEETDPAFKALNDGVQLVFKKFSVALVAWGVEPLECIGQPFDEELHEAMMQQPSPDPAIPSGTVLAEIQPGYRMGDRVLRHARVVVAQ